jgi:hypothetical protein
VDNGLPQLPAKTGPSTTDASTNRKHLAVQLSKRDMKVLKNGQGDFSYQAAPKSSTIHRTLTGVSGNNWNSETDIHMFVKEVLAEVLACLGLHDVHLLCEVSLDGERTDIMLLSRSGVRLGVVEVKKPAGKNPLGCDDKPSHIHGQVRDYLLLLNTYHSCQHAFGIATSYEQWRFYWLEEESNDYLDEQSASASSSSASSSSEPAVKKKKRGPTDEVYGSRVFRWDETQELVPALMSCVYKMCKSCCCKDVKAQALLKGGSVYLGLSEDVFVPKRHASDWMKGGEPMVLDYGTMPGKEEDLYILRFLGCGRDGRAFLVCDEFCRAGVVKMGSGSFDDEAAAFNSVNGGFPFPAVTRRLCGSEALLMPYVTMLSQDEWEVSLPEVRSAVVAMASKGIKHTDLVCRHVGWLSRSDRRIGFIDLAHAEATYDGADDMLRNLCADVAAHFQLPTESLQVGPRSNLDADETSANLSVNDQVMHESKRDSIASLDSGVGSVHSRNPGEDSDVTETAWQGAKKRRRTASLS